MPISNWVHGHKFIDMDVMFDAIKTKWSVRKDGK